MVLGIKERNFLKLSVNKTLFLKEFTKYWQKKDFSDAPCPSCMENLAYHKLKLVKTDLIQYYCCLLRDKENLLDSMRLDYSKLTQTLCMPNPTERYANLDSKYLITLYRTKFRNFSKYTFLLLITALELHNTISQKA
ncbi:hypothetical protein BpHYR1_011050 [Brachionus plicatilis]|uniref:Uncharacterized protein n=1 Tax=Brachionus plicatilis TaxID=10195 RepID=A0A3M7PP31_BRAPC|nr:hypothetical protein BpHYR1_011050 [Brachionus plicatilis]